MSIRPPLTDAELQIAELEIERHPTPDPQPRVATYEVLTERDVEPRVEVTRAEGGRWQVRVEADEGSEIRAAGIEAVVIPRDVLAVDQPDPSDRALRPALPEQAE